MKNSVKDVLSVTQILVGGTRVKESNGNATWAKVGDE